MVENLLAMRETRVLFPWVRKIPWRKKWQPIPVLLPGEFHGQRSRAGYSPWGCKESDTTEQPTFSLSQLINNVVLVSRVQQSDSVVYIHIALLPFRLSQYIEQSSLHYKVGLCWLSILFFCLFDFGIFFACLFEPFFLKFIYFGFTSSSLLCICFL